MRFASCLFLALSLAVAAAPAGAQDYQVVEGHPRLFITPQTLPEIRAKCAGSMAGEYGVVKALCDDSFDEPLPFESRYEWEWHLGAYSFVWLVTGEPAYADRAKEIAQYMLDNGLPEEDIHRKSWIHGCSIFYDWCYDTLSESERSTFGNAIADAGEAYDDYINGWSAQSGYYVKLTAILQLAYYGLAIHGDGIRDETAAAQCDTFYANVFGEHHALCCMDEIAGDGSYFQGEYNYYRIYMDFREACELWATATDVSPFEYSGNLANLGRYYLYEAGSKRSNTYLRGTKQGDTHTYDAAPWYLRQSLYNVASRYQDGYAQWLGDEIERLGLETLRWERWKPIIYRDPDLAPVAPTSLPNSTAFMKMGTVYMRSGWDLSRETDDVHAVFRCERYRAGHAHADQNHIGIARGNDLLAIDSGAYDSTVSSHHFNYFERTVAHNTVTVYDPNETSFAPYANDGGQIPTSKFDHCVHCGDASTPEMERGSLLWYREDDEGVNFAGDATPSYAPYKVTEFTRECYWWKPDVFVILDRVTATSPSYDKRWLLHSLNEPQIAGDIVTIEEGDSKLMVRTLLPANHVTTKVGGPGREFEVDGANYPPSSGPPSDAGAWRIEVSPESELATDYFLHVLYVTDAVTGSMPEVSLIESEATVGVDLVRDGLRKTVTFTKTVGNFEGASFEIPD